MPHDRNETPRRFSAVDSVYRADWTDYEYPSTAVVEAVAAATDRDVEELALLDDYVDGDALDALLLGSASSSLTVTFDYGDVAVSVRADGQIDVHPEGASDAE